MGDLFDMMNQQGQENLLTSIAELEGKKGAECLVESMKSALTKEELWCGLLLRLPRYLRFTAGLLDSPYLGCSTATSCHKESQKRHDLCMAFTALVLYRDQLGIKKDNYEAFIQEWNKSESDIPIVFEESGQNPDYMALTSMNRGQICTACHKLENSNASAELLDKYVEKIPFFFVSFS